MHAPDGFHCPLINALKHALPRDKQNLIAVLLMLAPYRGILIIPNYVSFKKRTEL